MFFILFLFVFFFKQKTAYEMRISDWSSDVCSSDLCRGSRLRRRPADRRRSQPRSPAPVRRHVPRQRSQARSDAPGSRRAWRRAARQDRKSVVSGKSVSVRVNLGGRRIIKKKNRIINRNS